MALTSDLLTAVDDLDDSMSASGGGSDETRAVRALNRAQDLMEWVIAQESEMLATVDESVTTTANQEHSNVPTRTRRIDSVWILDSDTSRPEYELDPMHPSGSHREGTLPPLLQASSTATGKPTAYWYSEGDGRLYWDVDPDTSHTMRIIGFFGAADMTISPDSTFAYDDAFILPVAQIALRVFKHRQDDPIQDLQRYTQETLQPVLSGYRRSWRHGPRMPKYRYA